MSNLNHSHAWARSLSDDEDVFDDVVRDKPTWKDGCGHPPESFVGSVFAYPDGHGGGQWVDVYVFDDGWPDGESSQQVCLRVGDEPQDYLSVGTVLDLLVSANRPQASGVYQAAAALIDRKFRIRAMRV
jgi:hypothetical protein